MKMTDVAYSMLSGMIGAAYWSIVQPLDAEPIVAASIGFILGSVGYLMITTLASLASE